MICTALNTDETIAPFKSGKYLIVYDEVRKEAQVCKGMPEPECEHSNRSQRIAFLFGIQIAPKGQSKDTGLFGG